MANKEKRFETIYTQGISLSIVVDTETGVNYLIHDTYFGWYRHLHQQNFEYSNISLYSGEKKKRWRAENFLCSSIRSCL